MNETRSKVLYKDEVLKVIYAGNLSNFPKNKILKAFPKGVTKSGLSYPNPKWIACDYCVKDLDGDDFTIARERYGELYKGFKWIK